MNIEQLVKLIAQLSIIQLKCLFNQLRVIYGVDIIIDSDGISISTQRGFIPPENTQGMIDTTIEEDDISDEEYIKEDIPIIHKATALQVTNNLLNASQKEIQQKIDALPKKEFVKDKELPNCNLYLRFVGNHKLLTIRSINLAINCGIAAAKKIVDSSENAIYSLIKENIPYDTAKILSKQIEEGGIDCKCKIMGYTTKKETIENDSKEQYEEV